ncbi:MAG: cell division inhibitor SulA [Zhongshania sp.]|jgi:cell division inhibitor SulA
MPLHYSPAPALNGGKVTEITMRSDAHLSRPMLAAMMIELSGNSDQRWLCWVADRPLKPLLNADVHQHDRKILQVVSNSDRDLCEIAVRALERGKSHTVAILLERPLRDDERDALEVAAHAGEAECLVVFMQS